MTVLLGRASLIWRNVLRYVARPRFWIALIAIGHGVLRLTTLPALDLSYGDSAFFGGALVVCGLAVLLTTRVRLRIMGRLTAICLAIVYALLGASLVHASPGSAWADTIFVLALLVEAGAYE